MTRTIAKVAFLFIAYFLSSEFSYSQDFQFSQFYNVPLYQNPAFAGSLHTGRVSMHQRLQWPKLDARYTTSVISADKYFSQYKSGVGMLIMQDYQGGHNLSSTQVQVMYSYEMLINKQLTFRPGLQLGYVSEYVDYSNLRFPHQYNNYGMQTGPDLDGLKNRKGFADVSAGGILYSRGMWVGFTANHLNTPNQSFAGGVSKLPAKFSLTSGYKIVLYKEVSLTEEGKEISVTPTFHYKSQGTSDQLDLGLYGAYNDALVGLWYRGIPIKRYANQYANNESFIVFAGWKGESFRVGYSYDFIISKLATVRTGGAHELNLTYIFRPHQKKKKILKRLPCPSF
ncbi:MAG: type IX secretion system membrane protein PorP/SprF [Cytophagaceae bacterium]